MKRPRSLPSSWSWWHVALCWTALVTTEATPDLFQSYQSYDHHHRMTLDAPTPPQLNGQHFNITVLQEGSFLTVEEDDGVYKVGGYLMDMLNALAQPQRANFTYTLLPPSGHGQACTPQLLSTDRTNETYGLTYRTQYNCGSADVNDLPHTAFTTDMYLGLYYVTPARQLTNQFTLPYSPPYRGTLAMYGTATGISGFEDLLELQQQGLQPPACAPGGTALVDFLMQSFPGIELVEIFGGDDAAIDAAFQDGTCQVYITDAPLVTQFVLKRSLDPDPQKCLYQGKPIGLIGEPMKFGLSHYAIGIRRDIPIEVEHTLSYWINVLMSCNSLDPNGPCPDGNLADFYASQGGSGQECGYIANPPGPVEPKLSPWGIVGTILASAAISFYIYRCLYKWQSKRQQERIQLLEAYRRRLGLLEKVAFVQREYLGSGSDDSQIVYQTLLEGIVELMDSSHGVMGQVKLDEKTGKPYLHIDASVHKLNDTQNGHRQQVKWTTPIMELDVSGRGDMAAEESHRNGSFADHEGFWHDRASRKLINRVLTIKQPVFRNEIAVGFTLQNSVRNDSTKSSAYEEDVTWSDIEGGSSHGKSAAAAAAAAAASPMENFLGIPFFAKGGREITGMIAIANKKGGYTMDDVQFLEPFSATITNLVQAFWQIARNEHLINTLEKMVEERTLKLQVANRELEQANERVTRASADQLTHFASMSHEIRTPLNCIIGLSSMLLETKLTPSQEEEVRMIVTSGDLLLTVVNDILDYSKLESGNVEINVKECNLQDTMNAVVHAIESKSADKGVTVRKLYDLALPECVRMDGLRVQQIMYNLIGNAVKFSKDGGVIDVSIQLVASAGEEDADVDATRVFFPERDEAAQDSLLDRIRFCVKDYGNGIEKQNFDKIFKPFSQADIDTQSVYGGTGLGLAISSKLAHALGGSISVDSVFGEWTEFTVDIPFEDKPVDIPEIRVRLRSTHIFCVIQDDKVADHVRTILESYRAHFSVHSSLADVDSTIESESELLIFKTHVCLVDERLYNSEAFEEIKARVPCRLFSFGSTMSVPDTEGHFRDITHIFPSVLGEKLALMGEGGRRAPRVSSRFSMSRQSFSSFRTIATNSSSDDSNLALSSRRSFQSDFMPPKMSLSPLRVMIAEDNLINQKVLLRLLKRLDVEDVKVVDNGAKAVELETKEEFDVVFMDYQMPIMDGVEACRQITRRENGPHPPPKVVFVTANASADFETECYEAGCVDFLPKPFNVRDIEALLESLFS